MIEAVLFDLYETLVTESGGAIQRASALAVRLGVDEEDYRRLWRSRCSDIVLGRCSFREVLVQIAHTLGATSPERIPEQLPSERMTEKSTTLRAVEPEVLDMLTALRSRRLRLGVVSNCFAEDVAGWERSPLGPYFDATVFSFATGLAKPDPEMYLLACRELHVPPSRALYIGDGADDELEGARKAGLSARRALWFLSRWPHVQLAAEAAGLRHLADVSAAAA
jgi:putative hydrolase of the HAD superfamily